MFLADRSRRHGLAEPHGGRAPGPDGELGGYPCAYVMRWDDLLPELLQQPRPYEGPTVIGEDYVMEQGWWQGKKVNEEALKRCKPDTIMRVNAWDQS